jgi:WD40 repeat protein
MMIVQILQEEPPSPRKLQSRIPRDLDTICLKCLEKDPSRRYATAQALADDLRHFLAGEAIHARPIGRLARLWRWSKRQPVVAGLGTAVAVSLVAGTLVASLFAIQAYKERDRANHQRDIAALRSYRTGLAMTQLALDRRDFRAAEQAIAECAQSFRGWEFGYLRNRLDKVIAFRLEPPTRAPVTSLAVHPARPLVAAGTGNGGIEIWNAKKGTHLVHLAIPSKEPQDQNIIIAALSRERAGGVQFSPDGKLLAVYAPVSSSTFVWDWEREKLVYQRQGQERNFITFSGSQSPAPAFSPDGKYLATYVPNGVQLLRRADWKEVWRNTDTSTALAFTKDGKHLIAGGTFGYIKILSSDTGAEKRTITGVAFIVLAIDEADAARQRTYGHQGAITSILPLVDGQRFATGSVDGTVRVWRLEDGKRAGLLQHVGAGVSALTYAPNGQDLLAVSSDGVLQAMRPDDSVPHDSLYYRDFVAVACEPRQALLATATKSSVLIWGDNLFLEPNSDFALLAEGKPGLICFSPDGSLAAMFVQQKLKEVVVIDVKTHKPRFKIPDDWAYDLRFSADSKRLLVSSTCITCYSTETGEKLVQSDPIHKPNITYGERKTPDGKVEKFVQSSSFGHSNERGLWSEANRLLVCGGYPLTAWNESGKRAQAIEVRSDSMVETHSLNLGTGEQSRSTEYLKHNVSRPWESPDHSTIVGDVGDGTIRGWDLSRGQEVFRWKLQKGRLADILANGNLLVENEEKAWEMWTWGFVRHIGVLKHDGPIRCVAVNPRQDRVVTGGEDGKVAIWHMETGEPLLTLTHGRQPISSVAFSNDGQSLSAVNESGLVRTWDAADIAPTR